ncbi:helix-turn-helix domain-containing protein [bacterium]|nr:helix-turn-helix domain-containing protein [bacterium]
MAEPLRIHTPDPAPPAVATLTPAVATLTVADPSVPLVADAKGLAKLLGLGVRTIRSHDAAGKLPQPLKLGGRVVWRLDELRAWLDAGAPDRATWAALRAARK